MKKSNEIEFNVQKRKREEVMDENDWKKNYSPTQCQTLQKTNSV